LEELKNTMENNKNCCQQGVYASRFVTHIAL
jgi:hypothetical protein